MKNLLLILLFNISCTKLALKSTLSEDYFVAKSKNKEQKIIREIKEIFNEGQSYYYSKDLKEKIAKLNNPEIEINGKHLFSFILPEIDPGIEEDLRLLRKLLHKKITLKKENESKEHPLLILIKKSTNKDYVTRIIMIFANSHINLNLKFNDGTSLFFHLLREFNTTALEYLLEKDFSLHGKIIESTKNFLSSIEGLEESKKKELKRIIELLLSINLDLMVKGEKSILSLLTNPLTEESIKEIIKSSLINFYLNNPSKYPIFCNIYNRYSLLFSSFFVLMSTEEYAKNEESIKIRRDMMEKALNNKVDEKYLEELKKFILESIYNPKEHSNE